MSQRIRSSELVQTNINPHKILNLTITKGLIPTKTEDEIQKTDQLLKSMKEFLNQPRVDRKQSRLEAEWIPQRSIAKVTRKLGKVLPHFGFSEKSEKYLLPHECLFLLETNILELYWNGVPFSIEQGYSVLITSKEDLEKYHTFKELANFGYKIKDLKCKQQHKINTESELKEFESQKRQSDESLSNEDKKNKYVLSAESLLFERLKQEGPTTLDINETYSPLFNVNLPKNLLKQNKPDFQIINRPKTNEFSEECVSSGNSSIVTACSTYDCVSFFQFHQVDLDNEH